MGGLPYQFADHLGVMLRDDTQLESFVKSLPRPLAQGVAQLAVRKYALQPIRQRFHIARRDEKARDTVLNCFGNPADSSRHRWHSAGHGLKHRRWKII